MTTDTPRTDALARMNDEDRFYGGTAENIEGMVGNQYQELLEFARQLERELAAHKTELTMWRDGEIKLANHSDEIDERRVEGERLRDNLSRLIEFAERYTTCMPDCPADYDGPLHCTCGYQKGIEEVWALRTTLNPTDK